MGLIKALTSSTSSALGDQFKEYVSCPTMENGTLVQRGIVHHGDGNKNPSEGIITNGSAIVVPESTAMMVVENGKILEFCAESGTYTFNSETEPSIFVGGLGKGIIDTIKKIGSRTTFGGQTANDQRVYYVNLLALTGNKFGSPNPKKITDEKYGMLEVTFFGEYAIKVEDPAVLINNIVGSNANNTVLYSDILEDQFKSKFVEKLTQAITVVMRKQKIPFGDIGMYGTDISTEMNNLLDSDLVSKYGIKVSDVAIVDINLTDESMKRVSRIDDAEIFSNRNLQSGLMADATAQALENASSNEGGAMVGFMGMNMANNAGASVLNAVNSNNNEVVNEVKNDEPKVETTVTEGPKFCTNCGTPNGGGNFCGNCGTKLR